ncbi:MAG: DJ-1/PfpI family protein [Drouetiella hepatica Uher 2000/2452]|jgi:cyclohexyl-isocyanide hydratase|uniref:DJ-1/PfpI family protein n=1 Tax=Drouetiella hepatica Uher 2000/2452 TaxID=904376 RepID=A0A951UQD4_9CYAN|nr:DJ-1/PfpI family protein [Drouetiella hepatica Uher 2000/2452]
MTQALNRLQIGILADPNCFVPDIIGVYTAFCDAPNCDIHFLWEHTNLQKNTESFGMLHPFPVHATTTFADCPQNLDVLCVGGSTTGFLSDEETLTFLADQGGHAKYLIGICAGSLTLAAAGLLTGYRATTNFPAVEALALFGAIPVAGGHVVVDRNRFTAGPVTGSFEAGLMVLAELRGEEAAKEAELTMEYAPHPPFGTGSPELAGPELTQKLMQRYAPFANQLGAALQTAAERLMTKA